MPKKNSAWGENTKAVDARERKAGKKREEQNAKSKAKEDAYWEDNNKTEQRKQARKQTEQQKKAEALARKQEAKKLLEEEEAKLTSKVATKAPSKPAPKKVTQSEIDKQKEQERKRLQEVAAAKEKEREKITENPEMEEENPNRKMAEILAEDGAVEARAVEDAISVLTVGEPGGEKHPEKRMKAAYKEFEQRELPRLKAEYPNLRLSQLKQMIYKEWQKSPDNPMNMR